MWIVWFVARLASSAPTPVDPPEPTPVVELSWEAPATCPDADDVRAAIVELVDRPLGGDRERTLRVRGVITQREGTFGLDLVVTSATGESSRSFTASRCDELVGPTAVVVALAVDPRIDLQPSGVVPDPPASAEPPTRVPPSAGRQAPPQRAANDVARASPPERTRLALRPRAVIGARGGVDGGILPGAGGILEGSVGVLLLRARIELVVLHLFGRDHALDSGGGRFRTTAARLQGCWSPGIGPVDFPLCGGVELGELRGDGYGVRVGGSSRRLWLALVTGGGVAWAPLRQLALGVRGELVVAPLVRRFTLGNDPLFTTRVVGGRGLLTVEVRLP